MTVEITLLMPMIIGVFLFLFFTLFYLHDVVAISKGAATALVRGMVARDMEENEIKEVMKEATEDIRMLGKWNIAPAIEITSEEVSVSSEGIMEAAEGLLRKLVSGDYAYEMSMAGKRIDEVEYIRSRRKR